MQPTIGPSLQVAICRDLMGIDRAQWDRLVPPCEPFLRHGFLQLLVDSGSVGGNTSWQPCHLLVFDADKVLVAALPMYEKFDSYGEFVFDWRFAEAALAAGLRYYPKLVAAVPFTPATGTRLLVAPHVVAASLWPTIKEALEGLLVRGPYSGVHVLFCAEDEQKGWQSQGFIARDNLQFHWVKMPTWRSFADFLASLRAPSRKQVRKERQRAASHGLHCQFVSVSTLSAGDLEQIYALYRRTVWEKGAQAYLTASFFVGLREDAGLDAYVAIARDGRDIVAMALFFRRGVNLYGRYWGAVAAFDCLHFELCYYLPIEWAIEQGIERFEAGAQGEHKLKRGLLPAACYSAHLFAHGGLHKAVSSYCKAERREVSAQIEAYERFSPYQRNGA